MPSFLVVLLTVVGLSVIATFKLWVAFDRGLLYKALMTILAWGIPIIGALLVIHVATSIDQKHARERASFTFPLAVSRLGAVLGVLFILLSLAIVMVYIPLAPFSLEELGAEIWPILDHLFMPIGYALSWLGNFLIFNYWLLKRVDKLNVRNQEYRSEAEAEDSRNAKKTLSTNATVSLGIGKYLFFSQARLLTLMAYIHSVLLINSSRSIKPQNIYDNITIDFGLAVFVEGLFLLLLAASMHSMLAIYRRTRQES